MPLRFIDSKSDASAQTKKQKMKSIQEVCKLFFLREIKKALLSENYFFASRLS